MIVAVYHLSHIDRSDWRYDAIHFPRIAEAPPEFKDVKDVTALAVNSLMSEGYFEHVADVIADDFEHAWRLTNTIDHPWHRLNDRRITLKPNTSRRSTSVGDVMECNGEVVMVSPIGYTPIKGLL